MGELTDFSRIRRGGALYSGGGHASVKQSGSTWKSDSMAEFGDHPNNDIRGRQMLIPNYGPECLHPNGALEKSSRLEFSM